MNANQIEKKINRNAINKSSCSEWYHSIAVNIVRIDSLIS